MTLVMAGVCIPLLAALGLKELFNNNTSAQVKIKALKIAAFTTGGIALLFFLIPALAGSFLSSGEKEIPESYRWLTNALISDRKMMLRSDAIRSAFLISASAIALWFMLKEKLKINQALLIVGALVLIDMWPVANRFLNSDNFSTPKAIKKTFMPSIADSKILEDKSEKRVCNLTVSTFNDGTTSYFHHSIGGYHGAKLMRYDELIGNGLTQELNSLISVLQKGVTEEEINKVLSRSNALNMLNTKYIIISPDQYPLLNKNALGNAWLVKKTLVVENADKELAALRTFNPGEEALVDRKFSDALPICDSPATSGDTIYLSEYKPNRLVYKSKTATDRIAVFSEIYYPAGWNAYIDGNPAQYFCADYLLRAMQIPSGEHTIIYSFEPDSYKKGNRVALASSLLLILLLAGVTVNQIIKIRKNV